MPPKDCEFRLFDKVFYYDDNNNRVFISIPIETIEAAELDDYTECVNGRASFSEPFTGSFEMGEKTNGTLQNLVRESLGKHGEKISVKISSPPCDSTLAFLIYLYAALRKLGCVVTGHSVEEIDNPHDKRYTTVFTVYGYFYSTNNWRKMHGVPMKRRIHNGKSKAKARTITA